jgi:hypothetical protein
MGQQSQDSMEANTASIILYDTTHYPSPPSKISFETTLDDTPESLTRKVAEKTGYNQECFEIHYKGKPLDPGKSLASYGLTKFMMNITRLPHAKVWSFVLILFPTRLLQQLYRTITVATHRILTLPHLHLHRPLTLVLFMDRTISALHVYRIPVIRLTGTKSLQLVLLDFPIKGLLVT